MLRSAAPRFGIITIGALALSSARAQADVGQFLFGLSGDNIAYNFMSAPVSRRVEFEMNLCNSGACLNESDWKCGFENNDDLAKVGDRFSSSVVKAAPWVKLDLIRKFCGVSLAQFTGLKGQVANPERCAKAGGLWRVKSKVHRALCGSGNQAWSQAARFLGRI
jgi:hypothetical protein